MKKLISAFFDFTKLMLLKLEYKRSSNWTGWDNSGGDFPEKEILERISRKLEQIKAGERQEVDLANYAMFLWFQRNTHAQKKPLAPTDKKTENDKAVEVFLRAPKDRRL